MGRAAKAYSSSGTWPTIRTKRQWNGSSRVLRRRCCNLNSSAIIDIIGSTHEQISSDACPANVRYHGVASNEEAVQRFTGCGLFIAPFKKTFGIKTKLLVCFSYGTPFAASKAALIGLPVLNGVPLLDLEDPVGSAQTLDALLNDSAKRASMSSKHGTRFELCINCRRRPKFGKWSCPSCLNKRNSDIVILPRWREVKCCRNGS